MNIRLNITKYLYLLATLLAFMSCEDFLNQNPDSRADLDTPDNISALLVSAYPAYSHLWFTEVMSDNTTDVGPEAAADDETLRQAFYWEKVDGEEQDSPDGFWYSCYTAIAATNAALEAIENLEDEGYYSASELNPLKGEALMCRAYAHFMLVNLFAEHYDPSTAATDKGIPYVTGVESTPFATYNFQTVEQVYDSIQKDFQKGYWLISDNSYDAPKWHFNKQAAATFISRYYLYRGLVADWDSVIYYANEALQDNPSAYLRDWLNTSDESFDVFGKNYSKSGNSANFLIMSNITTSCRAWYYRYTMSLDLLRDRVVYGTPHPTKTSITNDFVFINKAGGSTAYGCYGVFKYVEEFKRDGINANYGTPYVMLTPIEAEEALFNMMEAEVMKENYTGVLDLLNLYYSTRVIDYSFASHEVTDARITAIYTDNSTGLDINPHFDLTDKQKIYLKCIINIRASEFVSEGQRWFDIKRMHMQIEHAIYGGGTEILTPNDERRIIDIPDDASEVTYDALGVNPITTSSSIAAPSTYTSLFDTESLIDKNIENK